MHLSALVMVRCVNGATVLCAVAFWIALCLCSVQVSAQVLRVFDVDTSDFPVMKAKFYALDAAGRQLTNIQPLQLLVSENGVARTVTRITCQPIKVAVPISVVLTMDVSGSMASGGIDIAKAAARAFIEALPAGSECAITAFDHAPYLIADFSTDKKTLLQAVQTLKAQGGTDYDNALYTQPASALELVKRGRYKHVVVFLTDGLGGGTENAIVRAAREAKATVYCVTVAMPAPNILRSIALRTGGAIAEDVTTPAQAMMAFQTMLLRAQGMKPCEIEWKSAPHCEPIAQVAFRLAPSVGVAAALTSASVYVVPQRGLVALEVSTNSVGFKNVMPGTAKEQTLILTAHNADFVVNGFSSSNRHFTVFPASFTLQAGKRQQVSVRFSPVDSNFCFTEIRPLTDICNTSVIYAAGGFTDKEPLVPTLKVLAPNGGEALVVGTDSIIRWTGVLPQEKVRIELSVDEGKTWMRLGKPVSGLQMKWYRIPNLPSTKCLIRVSQFPRWEKPIMLAGHEGSVMGALWSPDGSRLLTFSSDKTARVWDTLLIYAQQRHSLPVQAVSASSPITTAVWDSSGAFFLTGSSDGVIRLWEATAPLRRSDTAALALQAEQAELLEERIKPITRARRLFLGHKQAITSLVFSNDGSKILSASKDGTARVWSAISGEQVLKSLVHKASVNSAAWSPDGTMILTASADKTVCLWRAATGDTVCTLLGHNAEVHKALWSPDGTRIITLSGDSTVALWEVPSGKLLRRYYGHSGAVRVAVWDSAGKRIATGSDDGMVCVWNTGDYDTPPLREAERALLSEADQIALDNFNAAIGAPRRLLSKANIVLDSTALDVMPDHLAPIKGIVWDTSRKRLFTASADQTAYAWKTERVEERGKKVEKFDLAAEFSGHNEGITSIALNTDGTRLVTTSHDGLALVWKTQATERQRDVSDNVFSIVKPEAAANPVQMGNVVLGTSFDSTVIGFVRNVGTYPFVVQDIRFLPLSADGAALPSSSQVSEFFTVSGRPPFIVPPQSSKSVEFGFKPTALGLRRATMLVMTNADTLRLTIQGRGVPPPLQLKGGVVDMGRVELGKRRDSVLVGWLKNTTSQALTVTRVRHISAHSADFVVSLQGQALSARASGAVQTFETNSGASLVSSERSTPSVANGVASSSVTEQAVERIVIPPNGARSLSVRFIPRSPGAITAALAVEYQGFGSPALLKLIGEAVAQSYVVQGKVVDSSGSPLRAKVKWFDIERREELGEVKCEPDGTYRLELPAGRHYGLTFERAGFLPASRNKDFRLLSDSISSLGSKDGDGRTVFNEQDVVLRSVDELRKSGGSVAVRNILFDFGSADLKPESLWELERFAAMLLALPTQRVEVAGHTDIIGGVVANRALSQRRAEAVVAYLVSKGCNRANLVARGYGSGVPVANNQSDEGRSRNRRVEFRFLK